VDLEDGPARAAQARIVDTGPDRSLVELVMVEGRNREVRRMLEHLGHPVLRLVRTAIGGLSVPGLAPGESRRLTASDVRRMLEAT
jgi:23S rRNA pseudouridine2605 synthase